ncbi:putative deoxycytidylate deaminase [Glycine max]|nr:putative deoxycytidylate deaminase [Glycine max]
MHVFLNYEKEKELIETCEFRYLSWDDYFMAIAFLSAERLGLELVIMDFQEVVLMTSYPGQRNPGLGILWRQSTQVNAILNTNHASAAGQRLYVTMFPCNECAKIIIQSGVSEVIYFVEKRLENSDTAYIASHKLLSLAGVKVRKHQPLMNEIHLKFEEH